MKPINILINTLLLAILTACSPTSNNESTLTQPGVSLTLAQLREANYEKVHYQLFFSIPEQKEEAVHGKVEVTLCVAKPQPIILDFRATPQQVDSISVNGNTVPCQVTDEHILIDAAYVTEGANRIAVSFTPANQSLNRREEFLYTLLVPDRARTLFPCFDQPNLKAVFHLTLEVPADWQAVANGAVTVVEHTAANRNRITFKETEPLSTYLFSFVAGKLQRERFARGGREISIYHRETVPQKAAQCTAIANEVFDALEWLEDYTAIPYPFAKYDLIILPGFQYGGMEHTGATLYADRRMFLEDHPTLDERLARSALIAHETAHMWFGDYVTMRWFDDVWTKEVFANYFASRIVEPMYPDVNHRLNFITDYLPYAYAEDRTAGSNPIKQELDNLRNAGLVYGNIIYDKSPVVMEMMVRMLGEEAFRKGIQEYLRTFAYNNATWDELVAILDKHTDKDLSAWSEVWVHQKGMPEVTASLQNGKVSISQRDPLNRGLKWEQELAYQCHVDSTGVKQDTLLLPNADGRGYGFFKVTEREAAGLWKVLHTSPDEVLRGSLLITLYENLRQHTITPTAFRQQLLAYLPGEQNPLLFSLALDYLGDCQRIFPADSALLEEALWQLVTHHKQFCLQTFRTYMAVADSPAAVEKLYQLWNTQKAPQGCALGENDYIRLSYQLAVHLPQQAEKITATQLARITNPDRQREYRFVMPAVSPRKEVRDSMFQALLVAENRRVEPWAAQALALLNHRLREKESVGYIRPALNAMPEVQRTGDIFFPTSWVRALLANHTSEEARQEVEAFFATHPDFPVMLGNKIRQQADHLRP